MGLFSLFRRDRPDVDDDEAYTRLVAGSEQPRQDTALLERQRDLARATVLKIDAIEAAMAADMFDEPAFRRPARPASAAPSPLITHRDAALPTDGPLTELLDDNDIPAEAAAAERAPALEEAARLYAGGQADAACALLRSAIEQHPAADRTAWWMLFDLYAVLGRQEAFDSLAIDYACTFEIAAPSWNPALADAGQASPNGGVMPTVALAGLLDGAAAAQIARLGMTVETAAVLRLDFSRVTGVEPEGCALLHGALQAMPHDRGLALCGAEELLTHLRNIVDVGRRSDGAAPWLLMLELLRLMNREKQFQETATDYGVTFGAPAPPFTPPGKVFHAPRQVAAPVSDRYLLPRTIEGDAVQAWAGIRAYAGASLALVFDCSHLARIDAAAAGHLLALLRELASPGRRIEFRELNHPVAALLRLLGYSATARLYPPRY